MNYAIVLSGGVGTRMKSEIPKQYIEYNGVSILVDTLLVFQKCTDVDRIVIVASDIWKNIILKWCEEYNISKVFGVTKGGSSRQESILNGLKACIELSDSCADNVIIHDAVRPFVSFEIIKNCFEALKEFDGSMPVLEIKDTIYQSINGNTISSLLDRDSLYAGQSPEAFNLHKYYKINENLTKEQLAEIRGTSQIAFQHGMNIKMIRGDENNFKITTPSDLERYYKIKGDQ